MSSRTKVLDKEVLSEYLDLVGGEHAEHLSSIGKNPVVDT